MEKQITSKLNILVIAKTLEKLFSAGFNTEKSITSMTMEDLAKLSEVNQIDMKIIIDLKAAIKTKSLIRFLGGQESQADVKITKGK